ncbi:uncharacterized protein [Nicotiana sylvestris]|uniref:uncharacterized protein n=1 Tax=Nicotiana sylvestris TaxID=4096 RepID=UPI00388C744C
MLTIEYELFKMKDDESIQDMHTRFTYIINELHSLGEIIPRNKLVRKIPSVLPDSWESKVNAITERKDLQKLTMDELVGNLKIYEMKKRKDNEIRESKKEKNMVPKTDINDSGGENADMAYLIKRFPKMVRRNGGIPKGCSSSKPKGYDLSVESQDTSSRIALFSSKINTNTTLKKQQRGTKKTLPANPEKMMGKDEEDDDEDEVNLLDVQRNLKSYSQKKLISLANILIDAYHNLINDKNVLTMELGEIERERDNLVVVMDDLKKTIEGLKRENDILTERITNIEHERDDLLVVVVDLKETIEELRRKNSPVNTHKGKEVASEAHLRLENELKSAKSSLCAELEKNRQLQADLGRVKSDLEKSRKWT